MQNPRVYNWQLSEEIEGLLLYAQRLEESLHDYTLDSYKAPALNTHTRCIELIQSIQEVVTGITAPKALVPVVEELCDSIEKDVAARLLLGVAGGDMRNTAWWSINDPKRLAVQAELVRGALARGSYERELRKQLEQRIPTGHEKELIQELAVNLAVEWMRMGFSQDFIYYRTRTFFFGVGRVIGDAPVQLREFFRSFEGTHHTYDVCVRATKSLAGLQSVLPTTVATITSNAPPARSKRPRERNFLSRHHDGVFLIVPDLQALDARSAGQLALQTLENIATLAYYHVHRTELAWDREVLVWEKNFPVVLKPPKLAIHKEDECSIGELPGRFKSTIEALNPNSLHPESWTRIRAALGLHASAISSQDVTVQLTTLWAAIETLIPVGIDVGRIVEIVDVLAPILSANYPRKLFTDLDDSLGRCNSGVYEEVLAGINTTAPRWLRCAEIIAVSTNEPLRDKVYAGLKTNPLLRNRIFSLKKRFSDAEKVLDSVDTHRKKVTWQVRRIYRTRNLLVHAGHSVPYREALVENLHNYFHLVVNSLEEVFQESPSPTNVDAAFLMQKVRFEHQVRHLKEMKNAVCTSESIASILESPR